MRTFRFSISLPARPCSAILTLIIGCLLGLGPRSLSLSLVSGAILNPDGGYEITLAIRADTDQSPGPPNSVNYLANVKNTLASFSNHLYRSTQGRFYIKGVEILIPSSWDASATDNALAATSQSFGSADVRVSDSFQDVHTENPNLCGAIGSHVEVPLTFFQKLNESPYGLQAKVLVTQWARLRWGVWEEHGFPSSTRFPYFHRYERETVWEVTGCSDSPLVGKYVDKYNEHNELCSADQEEPLRSDCRFQPAHFGNNATTSLMHFHWLESVTEFCDEHTHNHHAPNRQNLFCAYKSVWQVIRETSDYKAVTQPIEDGIPVTQFQIVKEQPTPVLYVLLDKGQTQFPTMVGKVNAWISRLFDAPTPGTTVASLATFPNLPSATNGRVVERVQWSPVEASRIALQNAVGLPSNGDPARDFGRAIIEAADIIKRKGSPAGAVFLIVKMGAGENSFGNLTYEKEVFAALSNEKIKVFGLELKGENSKPYVNMGSLLGSVGGSHTVVNSSTVDNPALFERLLAEIRAALVTPIVDETATETMIFDNLIDTGVPRTILVKPRLERINLYLTAPAAAKTTISATPGTVTDRGRPEWDEVSDGQRRVTYSGYYVPPPEEAQNGGEWVFTYTCLESCGNGKAHLLVTGVYAEPDPKIRRSHRREEDTNEPDIQVYTSAINGLIDLKETSDLPSPFTIFARVWLRHQPVAGLKVQARITSAVGDRTHVVQLVDNGLGNPDIEKEDGIYSGTFLPEVDGTYKIVVQVRNDEISANRAAVSRIDSRLLPIDQTQFGCTDESEEGDGACGAVKLATLYERSYDAIDSITFVNRVAFVGGVPSRILELYVPDISEGDILLNFTTPPLSGQSGTVNLIYNVYVAKEREHLLDEDHRKNHTLVDLFIIHKSNQPGSLEELSVRLYRWYDEVLWVAIEVRNRDDPSKPSALSLLVTTRFVEASTSPTASPGPTEEPITDEPGVSTSSTTEEDPSSTSETESPSSSTEMPESDDKSFWKKTEGIVTIVAIVIVGLAIIGVGVWYCLPPSKRRKYSTDRRQRESQREQSTSPPPPTLSQPS